MSSRNRSSKMNNKCVDEVKEKVVGKGRQATVYRSRNGKCVQKKHNNEKLKQREERIMTYINSIRRGEPYVIHGMSNEECCKIDKDIPYDRPTGKNIFLEHIEGSNLTEYFQSLFQEDTIKLDDVRTIFSNVLDGIEWLHVHGIAHGDIREDNIMWGQVGDSEEKKAVIVDFGASLLGSPTQPTKTKIHGGSSKSKRNVTFHSPRNLIRGSPLYGYTGTSNIKEMKIQDYKAIGVMFFRFVNRFMWKLEDKIDNENCYPFYGISATEDNLLFDSDNCEKSHKNQRSKRSCKCNYLNINTQLKIMLKEDLKKNMIQENEPLTIFNRLWKSLFSGKSPQKLNKEHCNIVINILHLSNLIGDNQEKIVREIFRNLTYLQTLITQPNPTSQKRRSTRKKKPPSSRRHMSRRRPRWKI